MVKGFSLLVLFATCKLTYASVTNNTSNINLSNATLFNNITANHNTSRDARTYKEYTNKSDFTMRSNPRSLQFLSESSFLHLGLGAVLSLSTVIFRAYVPNFLMRLARTGKSLPISEQINWTGLQQWLLEISDDPQSPDLAIMMKALVKNNAENVKWLNADCPNLLLCKTAKEAISTPQINQKWKLLLRTVVLMSLTHSNSFFDLMHPILSGHFGYNCSSQFLLCNWEKLRKSSFYV